MSIQTSFPVFEADQVLTNKHLNELRSYLEQQNRLTRSKLIGCGIVCGLEITCSPESIKVSCGCGLTSQGYIITSSDKEFTHLISYTPPSAIPGAIDFLPSCEEDAPKTVPFYNMGIELRRLITKEQFDKLSPDLQHNAVQLSTVSAASMGEFVISVFLEAEQISLKNCDTNDCNDKGSLVDFELVFLLVKKTDLGNLMQGLPSADALPHVFLKRYNVKTKNLATSNDVLNAFNELTDDATIDAIHAALNKCYNDYSHLLPEGTANPFSTVAPQLKTTRSAIINNAPVWLQYFYDYLDDIIKTYNELRDKIKSVYGQCGHNEFLFPLHLFLGEASANTKPGIPSAFRHGFIYSPLFDTQNERVKEIQFLFIKIMMLLKRFVIDDPNGFARRIVKITPSRYGTSFTGERCIPYYYNVSGAAGEQPLHQYWSFSKTNSGETAFIPGYNAVAYAGNDNLVATDPLLLDIEQYNFLRVEGHIGKHIDAALRDVINLKQDYNLPFDVIALSADSIGAILKGEDPKCVIQDLESNYRVIIAEFMCKLHDAFCSIYKFEYKPKLRPLDIAGTMMVNNPAVEGAAGATGGTTAGTAVTGSIAGNVMMERRLSAVGALAGELSATAGVRGIKLADLEDDDEVNELIGKINLAEVRQVHPSISTLVSEAHLTKVYEKGSSLVKMCGITPGTIGEKYISIIKASPFANPVDLTKPVVAGNLYSAFFELIDSIESMFKILLTNELSDLNMTEFKAAYNRYEKEVNELSRSLKTITDKVQIFLTTCIVEILQALKDEYTRRINQHLLANRFNAYFKSHGGVEHKAGVTKGGTFILVYYEETTNRKLDVNALFVNRNVGNLMLIRHPEILKEDTDADAVKEELEDVLSSDKPELELKMSDAIRRYLNTDAAIPQASKDALLKAIIRPPDKNKFRLTQGMVIADFFVPYLCCSDCAPIMYILPKETPAPTEDPVIKVDKNSFCNTDITKFDIAVSPAGGELTGTGTSFENGKFVFSPSGLVPGTYAIVYKANNKIASVQVTVMQAPEAKFSYKAEVNGDIIISFTNETTAKTSQTVYEWKRGTAVFSNKETPDPITVKLADPERTIQLSASNGGCTSTASQEIEIPAQVEKRKIVECVIKEKLELEPGNTNEVTDLIADGVVIEDKKTVLVNLVRTLANGKPENFISYAVPGGNRKEVTLVIQSNNADFFIQVREERNATGALVESILLLEAKNKNAGKYAWVVKQGNKAVRGKDALFPVKLRASGFAPGDGDMGIQLRISNDNSACNNGAEFILTSLLYRLIRNQAPIDNNFRP